MNIAAQQERNLAARSLLAMFVAALVLRVLYLFLATDYLQVGTWADSGATIATNLLKGKGYMMSWEVCRDFQSFRTPVLPLALFALWSTFGYNVVLAKLLMALVSAATCLIIAVLGTQLFDARVGLVAGWGAVFCSSFIRWSGTLGAETLTLFFLLSGVTVFCLPSARLSPLCLSPFARYALSGLLLGLLCLTRPVWLPYVAILALLLCFARQERQFKPAALMLGVAFLVMSPWVARNIAVHKSVVVASTEGGIAFLEANNPVSFAGKGDWARHFAANQPDVQRASRILPEAALDRFMMRKGLGYVVKDPMNFARVYTIRMGYLWRPSPPPQLAGDLSPKHIAWLNFWWGTLTALMLAALLAQRPWRFSHPRHMQHRALLMVLLWGSLIIPLFSSQLRYRAPLEPVILIYGVAGFFIVIEKWKTKKRAQQSA